MNVRLTAAVLGLGVLLARTPLSAHHSFAAEFDAKKPVTLKGTLTKVFWVSPHSRIYLDVKGPDGKVVNWAVITAAPTQLMRQGWRKEKLPLGTAVIVEGYRARDGSPTASAKAVSLANGKPLFSSAEGY